VSWSTQKLTSSLGSSATRPPRSGVWIVIAPSLIRLDLGSHSWKGNSPPLLLAFNMPTELEIEPSLISRPLVGILLSRLE
jgi:hypothetical protein